MTANSLTLLDYNESAVSCKEDKSLLCEILLIEQMFDCPYSGNISEGTVNKKHPADL